ncbi:LacI family transcriptional regulator [Chitinophaga skermanii]|uniref:LacI family transcriptional regulator n=1 Tax=Chitinophaga skermanii TaxID=331697 RepID=A0A327R3R4_9BACT|nr:LacI family DNA-binding transcriptional regulator [Chitinophaga skermanii]RAJ10845.1 LacI family transcriptional regulator [Chitinophaga skermanii]
MKQQPGKQPATKKANANKDDVGKVTIYDIANRLKISASTVSRALQNNSLINKETRELVQQTADELGYVPNWIASSLRKKRSNIIGLIVPRTSMYFQSNAISGIQHEAHKHGFSVVIAQSGESVAMEKEVVQTLYSLRVDGLLAASSMFTTSYEHFNPFIKNNIPLVFFDRVPSGFDGFAVTGDDFKGGFLATEHLILQGCKNIAHFAGALTCNLYEKRLAGYKAALEKYKIPFNQDLLFVHNLTLDAGAEAAKKIFSEKIKIDGLFAANDSSAVAFIQEARKHKIDVPGKIKVVGYSNDLSSRIISPSLTTIEQSGYRMGEKAASTLVSIINKTEQIALNQQYVFDVELILRESTIGNQ